MVFIFTGKCGSDISADTYEKTTLTRVIEIVLNIYRDLKIMKGKIIASWISDGAECAVICKLRAFEAVKQAWLNR